MRPPAFLQKDADRGLLATINSDDPSISAIDLPYAYRVAAPAAGLAPEQIRQAQMNALAIAFLAGEERRYLGAMRAATD